MVKTYPAIQFITNNGRRLAVFIGMGIALLAIGSYVAGEGTWALVVGLLVAIAVWSGLRLAAEVVEVISETLLPR